MSQQKSVDEILQRRDNQSEHYLSVNQAKLALLALIEEALPKEKELYPYPNKSDSWAHGHNSCLSQVRDGIKELFK